MTVETMLVDDLAASVNFRLTGTRTVDTALDGEIRLALDWALKTFVSRVQPQSFETRGSITLATNTAEYDLPDDFDQMLGDGVRYSTSPYYTLMRFTRAQFDRSELARETSSGRPEYYGVLGRSTSTRAAVMRVHRKPSSTYNGTVLYVHYRAFPTSIRATASGDASVIDKRFPPTHYLDLVDGALTKFTNYLTAQQVDEYRRNFQRAIDDAQRDASLVGGEGFRPDVENSGDGLDMLMDTTVT